MNYVSFVVLVMNAGLLVGGCSAPMQPLDARHTASASAAESATAPARPTLGRDDLTRGTEQRFAAVREVQTNEPPPIQQTGASRQQELGAANHAAHQHGMARPGESFTCPMHPQVRSDKPGACPKCGMKLVNGREASGAAHKH